MKKLSVMLAVVLMLALALSVTGLGKQYVVCKATGGAQLENVYPDDITAKVNFTFNATLYEGGAAKGSATWMDHVYGKTKFNVTSGTCNGDSVTFIAEIIATNVDGFEVGNYLELTVTDGGKPGTDTVIVDWIYPDLDAVEFDLLGGNIVVH